MGGRRPRPWRLPSPGRRGVAALERPDRFWPRVRGASSSPARSAARMNRAEGASIHVDRTRCDGSRLCAELLPELIRLDDWGYPIVEQADVPVDLLDLAYRAVNACPTLALLLEADRRDAG